MGEVAWSSGPRILLVEDGPPLQILLTRTLRDAGYRVHGVTSAEEALVWLEAEAGGVAVMVSDVGLPGMDGCTLARTVLTKWPTIRVLFITGYGLDDMRALCCPDRLPVLLKPFAPRELVERVARTLQAAPWHPVRWPERP